MRENKFSVLIKLVYNNIKCVEVYNLSDDEFNIKNYKISHNVNNSERKYGTITFIYYIGDIETNKGYLVNIEDNKVESITLGGIKKQNIKNIENVKAETLSKKISEFESNKKEKVLLSTSKVLNKNNTINKSSLSDNTISYTERYYYDFNESKLYYILDQSEKIETTYLDGDRFKIEIE